MASHVDTTPQPPSARYKTKAGQAMGITAGAEDQKYQQKYKELSKKVKEIELDNDKLCYKVMEAKRNIRRLRLERAILYERLAISHKSPDAREQDAVPHIHPGGPPLPPVQTPYAEYQEFRHGERDYRLSELDAHPNDRGAPMRTSIHVSGPDSRQSQSIDVRHSSGGGHNSVHPSTRSNSNSGAYEGSRHETPHNTLPSLPPVHHLDAPPRGHSHHHSSSRSQRLPSPQQLQQSPPTHHRHSNPHESQHVSRSARHSSGAPHFTESLPPFHHSPPLQERERSRHHESREPTGAHDPHFRERPAPGSLSPTMHTNTSRVHHHQRMGPGTYINRSQNDRDQYERDSDREWQRNSVEVGSSRSQELGSHGSSRSRLDRGDYPSDHHGRASREEAAYYGDNHEPYNHLRSDSPPPPHHNNKPHYQNGGSEGPLPRSESRDPYYDNHRSSFRLRPVNQTPEDYEEENGSSGRPAQSQSRDRGRTYASEREQGNSHRTSSTGGAGGSGSSVTSPYANEPIRKRARTDMDVDHHHYQHRVEQDAPGGGGYHGSREHHGDERGSKRFHHPSSGSAYRAGLDDMED